MIAHNAEKPYLLVLNSAEGAIQYLLAKTQAEPPALSILAEHCWQVTSQGVELLAPALDSCFKNLGVKFSELGHIACVLGPGSFTGLRLSTVTAAALARTTGALQGGLAYLPLLASAAHRYCSMWQEQTERCYWVATHARRNLVHAQRFITRGSNLCPSSEVLVVDTEGITARIADERLPCICLGSGVHKNIDLFQENIGEKKVLLLPEEFNRPHFKDLAQAALDCSYSNDDLTPMYVRQSDAEENIVHIAGLLHLNPTQAQAQLAKLTTQLGENDEQPAS